MKCKVCKSEIICVQTSSGKEIMVDFSSLSPIDINYLKVVNAERYPILFRSGEHLPHWASHPECFNKKEKE